MFDDEAICDVCGAEHCRSCHRREAKRIADAKGYESRKVLYLPAGKGRIEGQGGEDLPVLDRPVPENR